MKTSRKQLATQINAALKRIGTAQGSDWQTAMKNVHRITNAFGMLPQIRDGQGNSISEVKSDAFQFNGENTIYSATQVDEQIRLRQLQDHLWYCHAPQEKHPPAENLPFDGEISSSRQKEAEKRQDPRS